MGNVIAANQNQKRIQTMNLELVMPSNGRIEVIERIPKHVFKSLSAARLYLCQHADRLWGTEGKDYRICQSGIADAFIPLCARQIVIADGVAHYGESLQVGSRQ